MTKNKRKTKKVPPVEYDKDWSPTFNIGVDLASTDSVAYGRLVIKSEEDDDDNEDSKGTFSSKEIPIGCRKELERLKKINMAGYQKIIDSVNESMGKGKDDKCDL